MDPSPPVWVMSDAPYAGGAERYLEFLLAAAGPGRLGLVAVARPALRPWIEGVHARGFAVDHLDPGPLPAQWRQFHQWARRRRPRVVHVNMPGPNDGLFALAPLLAKLARVPRVVVTEHLPSVGRIGRRGTLKRWTTFAVDRAITVCQAHRDLMAEQFGYGERQLVTIPNAIEDPGPAAPGRRPLPGDLAQLAPPGRLRLVQVGSLDARKGAHRLLAAFAAVAPDASLWFVGDGPERDRLERLAADLGIAGRVVFAGRRSDLPRLMASFDLVALASEREGMPYVLLEAMAMARPILATAVDGVPELVVPALNGVLVGADDPIALARELRTACADPARLRRMGAAGRERFESEFDLGRFLEHTWRQYGEEARGWPTHIASS